jgi:hypothetical protein
MKVAVALVFALNFYLVSGGFFFNDGPDDVKKNVRVSFRFVVNQP